MWSEILPSGRVRFVERYEHPLTGKHHKVSVTLAKDTAATRKQAQLALQDKIDAKINEITFSTQKSDITLSELVRLYRADQKASVTASTYSRNYYACESLMKTLGKDTLVSRISAGYVREQFNKSGDSNGTLNERLARFKALMRWGYENDYISDIRFLDKLKKYANKEKKERLKDKFLESYELKELLNAMEIDKWRMLAALTALSGLRSGEAIALHDSDIDFDQKLIHVTKTYDYINHIVTAPKTLSSARDVYMQPELEQLCRQIHAYMLRQKFECRYYTDLFMCDVNGDHLNYYAYNAYLSDTSLRVLGRKITTHVMRHTHVALMAENGASLDLISRRLGHESSKITREVYYHVTEKMKAADQEVVRGISIL